MPDRDPFLAEFQAWQAIDKLNDMLASKSPRHLDKDYEARQDEAFKALSKQVERMSSVAPTTMSGIMAFADFLCDDFLHDESDREVNSLSLGVETLRRALNQILRDENLKRA